jgi:hypothetical protein
MIHDRLLLVGHKIFICLQISYKKEAKSMDDLNKDIITLVSGNPTPQTSNDRQPEMGRESSGG